MGGRRGTAHKDGRNGEGSGRVGSISWDACLP